MSNYRFNFVRPGKILNINSITMRKIFFYTILLVLIPITVSAQDADTTKAKKSNDYSFTFGINYGIDNNINGYPLNPNSEGNNFYKGNSHYSLGLDYGWMASKKLRPRIEVRYVKMSYGVGWDNANITTINESVINLYNFAVALHADYLLLDATKFQLFLSPGLKWEINVDSEEKNLFKNGDISWANYNDLLSGNTRNFFGGSVSAILKYNIIKNIGITLTPEYTLFFNNFVPANNKSYQRASVKAGVEFNFR